MARAKAYEDTESRDDLGPELLNGIKRVRLDLSPNETRALLVLFGKIDHGPDGANDDDRTLAGEISSIEDAIYEQFGVLGGRFDISAARYQKRHDLAGGKIRFLKGGAHV